MNDKYTEQLEQLLMKNQPEGDHEVLADRLSSLIEQRDRDENGYPLLSNGNIDWDKTTQEKQAVSDKYESMMRSSKSGKKPHKKHGTNYTPPKRRNRKK